MSWACKQGAVWTFPRAYIQDGCEPYRIAFLLEPLPAHIIFPWEGIYEPCIRFLCHWRYQILKLFISIKNMKRDWNLELAKERIDIIYDWLENANNADFSIRDLQMMHAYVQQVEKGAAILRERVDEVDRAVKKAEWEMFINTLGRIDPNNPGITNQAHNTDSADKIDVGNKIWIWDDKGDICGISYDVYCTDGEEGVFLYLFKNGRYYIEAGFEEPELVTREMMGFGKNTQYRKVGEDGIEITGSGTINIAQMFEDYGQIVAPDGYENPIIERETTGCDYP